MSSPALVTNAGLTNAAAIALTAVGFAALTADAEVRDPLRTELLATGLANPVYIGQPRNAFQAPASPDRLWVLEQRRFNSDNNGPNEFFVGQVRVLDRATGAVRPEPVTRVFVSNGNEQGLLGIAFHPDFPATPTIYLNYTRPGGDTVIEEQTIEYIGGEPFAVDGSARQLLTIDQPFSNHNAGWMDFGPADGLLYIATGDGGSGGDPGNRSQDITDQLLGKILRIDVDGDDFPADPDRNYAVPADNPFVGDDPVTGGDDEIWAYGLRNP